MLVNQKFRSRSRRLAWVWAPVRLTTACAALGGVALSCATTEYGVETEDTSIVEPSQEVIDEYRNPQGNPLEDLLAAESERRNEGFSAQSNWVSGLWHAELGAFTLAATVYAPLAGGSFGEEPDEGQCDEAGNAPDAVEAFCAQLLEVEPGLEERKPDAGPPQWVFIETQPNLPSTQVFPRQVLECARDAGFTHLAVEALQEDGAAVTERGHVTRQSGLLTREPQLARLISRGAELGYQIIDYDVPGRVIANQYFTDVETYAEEQATNLLAQTYDVDPESKVLVVTLPYEARKVVWREGVTRRTSVATLVEQRTGLEPYSIEQEAMRSGFGLGDPPSGARLLGGSGTEFTSCAWSFYPTRSVENDPPPLSAIVMRSAPERSGERWEWLSAPDAERMTVTPSCDGCGQLLVQAFPAGADTAQRIPTDQALCRSGEDCQLVLPAGDYDFVVWGPSGDPVGTQSASLEAAGSLELAL